MSNSIQYLDLPGIYGAIQQIQGGQQRSRLLELQSQMEQSKYATLQKQLTAQQHYGTTLPADQQPLFQAAPSEFIGAMTERLKPGKTHPVTEGGALVDDAGNVIYSRPKQSDLTFEGGGPPPSPSAALQRAAPAATAPPTPITPNYAANLKAGENTTGNPAAKNLNSTATGDHQFIEETFLDQVHVHRPDLEQGRTRDQILALREDPGISAEMANNYARDNAAVLDQAGFEATPTNVAILHRFGPSGGMRILQAEKVNPNTRLDTVLSPAAINANPHLRGMTIAQGRAQLDQHMNEAQQGAGQGGGAATGTGAARPPSVPQTATTGAPDEQGVRRVLNKGGPYTTGADAGNQWAVDGQGNWLQVPIRGSTVAADRQQQETRQQQELMLKQNEVKTKQADTAFTNENVLRDEFNTLTKDYRNVTDAYRRIQGAAKSANGPGDMAMLYAYVRLLDPNTGVKEGEFQTAAASGSFGERVQGAVQKILTGGRLPDDLRSQFLKEADGLFAAQKKGFEGLSTRYRGIAKRRNLNPDNVVSDYGEGVDVAAPPVPPATTTTAQAAPPVLAERVTGQTYQTPRGPAVWRGNGWELVR